MKTTDFSSSSSSDRRIGALLRHLTAGSDSDHLSSVYASPTSGVTGGSVFAHLVQAPEDPILGVPSFSSSLIMYVYNSQTYSTKLVDMCVLRFGSVRHLSIYEMREDLMFMLLNLFRFIY